MRTCYAAQIVLPEPKHVSGGCTFLLALGFCFIGCWPLACLPFCCQGTKDTMFLWWVMQACARTHTDTMYTVLLFTTAAVILLQLGYEFMAITNVLIHVGALAVMFVVMLIHVHKHTNTSSVIARHSNVLICVLIRAKDSTVPGLATMKHWRHPQGA